MTERVGSRTRWSFFTARALLALALVACGGGPVEPSLGTINPGAPAGLNASPGTTLPPVDEALMGEILADGDVTITELERAYLSFVACLVDGNGAGQYAYDLSVGSGIAYEVSVAGDADGSAGERVSNECQSAFIGDLESLYDRQHPATAVQVDAIKLRLHACLSAAAPAQMSEVSGDESYDRLIEIANEIAINTDLGDTAVAASDCVRSANFGEWRPFG